MYSNSKVAFTKINFIDLFGLFKVVLIFLRLLTSLYKPRNSFQANFEIDIKYEA